MSVAQRPRETCEGSRGTQTPHLKHTPNLSNNRGPLHVETGPERLAKGPYVDSQLIELQAPSDVADETEQFGKFYGTVAFNVIVDLVGKECKRPQPFPYSGDEWISKAFGRRPWDFTSYDEAEDLACSATPSDLAVEREEWERVESALAEVCVGKNDKAIVDLSQSGLSESQVGKVLGLSRDQVNRALRRIQKKAIERAAKRLGLDADTFLERFKEAKEGKRATGSNEEAIENAVEKSVEKLKSRGLIESQIGEVLGLSQDEVAEALLRIQQWMLPEKCENHDDEFFVKNGTRFPLWWIREHGSADLKARAGIQ